MSLLQYFTVDIPLDIPSKMVYFLSFQDAYQFAYQRVYTLGMNYRFLTLEEALGWLTMYTAVDIAQGPSWYDNVRVIQQDMVIQTQPLVEGT